MREKGELVVASGFASRTGPRADNQDFAGVYAGTSLERAHHGLVAALADGVSGARGGRIAAELAVREVLEGFYQSPVTLGPARALQAPLAAYNRWLHAQGATAAMAGCATTLSALALRGRHAHVAHVGDSRAWHYTGGRLACLTTDHTRPEPDQRHVLVRALGLESELRLDHARVELAERDRLVLTSDGVHGPLSPRRIAAILAREASAQATAEALVDEALAAGGQDNATALVLDIVHLPAPDHDGILADLVGLPVIVPPRVGETIDGFVVERLLSRGRHAELFVARDGVRGEAVVLKFPRPSMASDRTLRLAFAREVLIARRVASPFVLGAWPLAPGRQSALYGVQPFVAGETMAQRLERGVPGLTVGLAQAVRLVRAVAALHRLEIVHRDIKPENVMLTAEGGLKLIDMGVARLPRVEDLPEDEIPGTPGFLAPEQFAGQAGDALTDQFALGVTLFFWFTGAMPYGEAEAFQRPRFGPAPRLAQWRPDMPSWLDDAIRTAIQPRREQRHGDVWELLAALEAGGPLRVASRRPVPLIERDPVRFWQGLCALLALALVATLVAALVHR